MRKEHERLIQDKNREVYWKRWGPYLSERAWGTVREDYSANGDAWGYFTHDQARSRAYRWSEDGIAGFCDRHQLICFAVSMWNGHEDILIRITAWNRGPDAARLHLLPTIWFRNTWSWKEDGEQNKPRLERIADMHGVPVLRVYHAQYGERWLYCDGSPQLLFTENES